MEARVCLRGSLTVCGVQTEQVPGETLKEKRKCLLLAPHDDLAKTVKKHGWCARVNEDDAIVIHTGCVIMMICPKIAMGVRWQRMSDDNDRHRVLNQLKDLMHEFPETRASATGYNQLFE